MEVICLWFSCLFSLDMSNCLSPGGKLLHLFSEIHMYRLYDLDSISQPDSSMKQSAESGFTYFFSMLCFSLPISPKRRSKLSHRSRVSLNLTFMLVIWKTRSDQKWTDVSNITALNLFRVLSKAYSLSVPPLPSPSPDERSYSPSRSSETPVDSSAGTSTADTEDELEPFCAH